MPQKEYFVQEYIKQGITNTRTVIYGRDVLNKGRFVLAPMVHAASNSCVSLFNV